MKTLKILKEDVIKSIYFIVCLAQDQSGSSMFGTISSKGDLIGGIFDRFINILPETIIFNNYILKEVAGTHSVEVVRDNYSYTPNIVGVATDVIGLNVDGRIIPFAVFNERWEPVKGKPQIEVKTCKKPDKMFSIRNQGYDDKYLVIVETDFRIDYLVPLLDKALLDESIIREDIANDRHFILSNSLSLLKHFNPVNYNFNDLGSLTLLRITNGKKFMDNSTFCDSGVSVERINKIEEYNGTRIPTSGIGYLKDYCDKTSIGLYRFKDSWYHGVDSNGITVYHGFKPDPLKVRTLDFACSGIDNIKILKRIKKAIYVTSSQIFTLNGKTFMPNKIYKISYEILQRSDSSGSEYFIQKENLIYIPDDEVELKTILSSIINS